jgi:thiamine pyrophosphate-dependent acetolactate synthase large subunit-like protein
MSASAEGRVGPGGPVLLGIVGPEPAEAAIRHAFAEADDRGVALLVVVTAAVPVDVDRHLTEVIERWSEKYPGVAVTAGVRRDIDAVVTLAAASRDCAVLVTQQPSSARSAALVTALSRRARCPVVVADDRDRNRFA